MSTLLYSVVAVGKITSRRTRTTPIHCIHDTCSFNTIMDMHTAVGNSEALKIVPSPLPTCGIEILNKIGGRTTPNMPRIDPHIQRPSPMASVNNVTGG